MDNIMQEIEKWKNYYLYLGKAISEYSKELNVVLRQFCVKKLFKITNDYPNTVPEIEKFFKSINIKNPKKIAEGYNTSSILSFDDFADIIEKIFESVEDLFNEEILDNNDFSNYIKIMSIYKLLRDLGDFAEAWGEMDEKIEKFQNYCKFRVVDINERYQKYLTEPKTDLEIEWLQLVEAVKKEKEEEKKNPNLKGKNKTNERNIPKKNTNEFQINSKFTTGNYPKFDFESPSKINSKYNSNIKRTSTFNNTQNDLRQGNKSNSNTNNKMVRVNTILPKDKPTVNINEFPSSNRENPFQRPNENKIQSHAIIQNKTGNNTSFFNFKYKIPPELQKKK